MKHDPKTKYKPVLNENEGYFQIGPVTNTCNTFVLSITILFAKNLIKVCDTVQSVIALPSSHSVLQSKSSYPAT
jgi:hypothetical protein